MTKKVEPLPIGPKLALLRRRLARLVRGRPAYTQQNKSNSGSNSTLGGRSDRRAGGEAYL
jgi:hypothetical protein